MHMMRTDANPAADVWWQLPASTVQVGEHATLADAGDGNSRMPLSARQWQRLHPSVQVRASPNPNPLSGEPSYFLSAVGMCVHASIKSRR
jgi:hypothetical protein